MAAAAWRRFAALARAFPGLALRPAPRLRSAAADFALLGFLAAFALAAAADFAGRTPAGRDGLRAATFAAFVFAAARFACGLRAGAALARLAPAGFGGAAGFVDRPRPADEAVGLAFAPGAGLADFARGSAFALGAAALGAAAFGAAAFGAAFRALPGGDGAAAFAFAPVLAFAFGAEGRAVLGCGPGGVAAVSCGFGALVGAPAGSGALAGRGEVFACGAFAFAAGAGFGGGACGAASGGGAKLGALRCAAASVTFSLAWARNALNDSKAAG
ncbi:MAG TPA: hypothetical protein VFA50_16155 [Stellaceae bacterium]|nr:hypothetical protein [Stellaceae bacterium]